ncbi:zinc ribbon domain-containing protein, partial [Desulfobacterales bacterium HSG16]|nr:zinc ribbon domain-containing protein [Desulfobacterales bacterium HSG16]
DGLGWGVPYLYLCFNDECSLYKNGWDNLEENYGQLASYRCLSYPGSGKFDCMPVFSPMGATGQVIDEESIAVEEMLKANVKRGFSILADCYVGKDGLTVLNILLDPAEPSKVRLKAAEMIGDVGALEAVDTLRNHKFGTKLIQEKVDSSISKIHGRFFTRECPFCAEIIKKQAKICKHCGKDVAGQ